MRKTNSKGFTIIELLVVIVIIGILVALALPQLFAAQARGRDTERKNDLKNIKTQLETFFNDKGYYPTNAQAGEETYTPSDVTGVDIRDVITGNLQTSLGLTDEDLVGPRDDPYDYTTEGDGSTYSISADLENESDSSAVDGVYTVESVNQTTEETPAP